MCMYMFLVHGGATTSLPVTFSYIFGLSAHTLPHFALFYHILPTFPRENSLGEIAALLRRPHLS